LGGFSARKVVGASAAAALGNPLRDGGNRRIQRVRGRAQGAQYAVTLTASW
jgi:hypothetical protein